MKNKISIICLAIVIILSSISYIPSVFADMGIYNKLHIVILIATIALFLISNRFMELLKNGFMNKILLPLFIFILFIVLLSGLGLKTTTKDILQIGVVYVSLWVGYELELSYKVIIRFLFLYAFVAIYLGYVSITTYLLSFSMDANMYLIEAKNQIGAIVSIATLFMFYTAQISKDKKIYRISYVLCVILLVLLIYIRCRTALLAFLFTAFVIIYKLNDSRTLMKYSILAFLILIASSGYIIDIMQEAFLGDRSTADMDVLSSNRLERNEQALVYMLDHLMFGELEAHSGIEIIHNYVLNRIVRYGIWALPLIYIYILFCIRTIKQTLLVKKVTFYDIGYFSLIIPLICSLLEPDAPFGPGTVYSYIYIIFGYSLRKSLNTINK